MIFDSGPDPRFLGETPGQSWILDPGPNQESFQNDSDDSGKIPWEDLPGILDPGSRPESKMIPK